jgi:Large polyvalent protein associated domain 38/ADP-Ribosyltransferase in polyvalent proteins
MSLPSCLNKAAKALHRDDSLAIQKAFSAYRQQGLSERDAGVKAVQDMIDTIGEAKISPKVFAALNAIARAFGKRIKLYNDRSEDGYVDPAKSREVIYLNENAQVNGTQVFFHELFHLLILDNPKAFAAIAKVINPNLTPEKIQRFREYYADPDKAEAGLIEEIQADLFAEVATADESFWGEVFAEVDRMVGPKAAPGVVARLGAALNKVARLALKALNAPGFTTSEIVGEIEGLRDAYKTALATYIAERRTGAPVESAAPVDSAPVEGEVVASRPRAWKKDSAEDVKKADVYEEQTGERPYTSEGQLDIPIGPLYSVKRAYSAKDIQKGRGNDPMTGLPLNQNGTVTLYFPTTNAVARTLAQTKKLTGVRPDANRVYLTNESSGPRVMSEPGNIDHELDGANVMLMVDPNLLQLDKEYEDGRKDFFIPIAEGQAYKAKMTKLFTLDAPRTRALSKDTKLTDIETRISASLDDYLKLTNAERRARLAEARAVLKEEHNVGTLLGINGKLEKTNLGGYGVNNYEGKDVMSMGLGLASAQKINEKNLSTCPNSAICEGLCLGETSGQNLLYGGEGQWKAGPRLSQYLKTEALVLHPEEFAIVLHSEIERFQRASVRGDVQPSVRLNVTSDFRPKTFAAIINAFPKVEFYDYTKLPTESIAPNHHLTYSSTGATQMVDGKLIVNKHSNWDKMVRDRLMEGMNVAMAFTSRKDMPDYILDERTGERFQVWNGDNYDARFLDPKPGQPGNELNRGMIIGLTNKDRTTKPEDAAAKHNGFFLDYDRARDGDTLTIRRQSESKTIEIKRSTARSPAFKAWFGDSKIVNADGTPRVMYHGTARDITEFQPKQANAIYVTGSPRFAEQFADASQQWKMDHLDQFMSPEQIEAAKADAIDAIKRRVKNPKQRELEISEYRYTKEFAEAVRPMLPSGENILPLYVKAEKPFDYESEANVQELLSTDAGKDLYEEEFPLLRAGSWRIIESPQVQRALKEAGFDAFYVKEGGEKNLAVYSSTQLKSATGNSGEFSPTNPDITRSTQRQPFYSALAKGVEGIGTKAAPAAGWKDAIKGLVNKGVAKADEVEWSGVNDWLDLQEGKVTKQAVSDYLKEGGVRVEETVLGKPLPRDIKRLDEYDSRIRNGERLTPAEAQEYDRLTMEELTPRAAGTGTKYSTYTLPGGENYREVLLRLPAKSQAKMSLTNWRVKKFGESTGADYEGWEVIADMPNGKIFRSEVGEEDAATEQEALAIAKRIAGEHEMTNTGPNLNYEHGHWRGQYNVISHIRVNDRTDADGKRVLFIEEIQSDWGQSAKRDGFKKDGPELVTPDERKNLILQMEEKAQKRMIAAGLGADQARYVANGLAFDTLARAVGMKEQYDDLLRREMEDEKNRGLVPVAPFVGSTPGWLNLSLKRVITLAVEGGYDRVAFITGDQAHQRFPEKANGESTKDSFQAFYDIIIPTTLKKLLPKVGGGQMGSVRFRESRGFEDSYAQNNRMAVAPISQPGFDVTPAMREKAADGLPLFSTQRNTKAFKQWFGDSKVVDENGEPLVVYHGTIVRGTKSGEQMGDIKAFDRMFSAKFRAPSIDTVGSWFSTNPGEGGAQMYSGATEGSVIYPVYLSIKNPQVTTFQLLQRRARLLQNGKDDGRRLGQAEVDAYRKWLKEMGKDGIKIEGSGNDNSTEFDNQVAWIVLEPTQIKSATGNNGDFDPTNPDITRSTQRKLVAALAKLGVTPELVDLYADMRAKVDFVEADREFSSKAEKAAATRARTKFFAAAEAAGNAAIIQSAIARIVDMSGVGAAFDSPDITRSTQRIVGQSSRTYDADQKAFFENVGRTITVPTLKERYEAIRKDIGKKLAQGIADQFAPIKELSSKAYALARLSKGSAGAVEAFLNHGKLSIRDGAYDADQSGGFVQTVGAPLQGELEDFLWWVAANRAEKLTAEDRENLFTQDDIDAGKTLADGTTKFDYTLANGQTTRDRRQIYEDSLKKFDAFNKNAMDMAEQSGLIDGASRQYWENEFYVPFYRQSDEEGFVGARIGQALVRQRAFKELKGGAEKLNSDLLANVLQNWAHLIDAAAKNRAAVETLEAAAQMGAAHYAPAGTKKSVWVMTNGAQQHYLVEDPYLVAAIQSLEFSGLKGPLMDAMSKFKQALTIGVTASPVFKINNLIRDSIQAIGTSPLSYNPLENVRAGSKEVDTKGAFKNVIRTAMGQDTQALKVSQTYVSALASGGLIRFGNMTEGRTSDRVRQLIKAGVKDSTILDSENKYLEMVKSYFLPAFDAYNELGNRGEEINRAALFKQLEAGGMDHAQASLLARDLMDFSMQGSWTTVRFLSQVVPFLNARIQGLYKLGRAANEDRQRFQTVVGAVALASVSLMLAYSDDEDWKKREDWDRDNFWWFKIADVAFRIPKPFEIGAIGTLAERGVEYFASPEMTGARFMERFRHLLTDNLAMNPVPQMVKPILDLYSNKDGFTGRPIETLGMERLQSEYRFTANTSMLARAASTASMGAMSPVQIDHAIRGYFGWLGTFVVSATDTLVRPLTDEPTRPAADLVKVATGGLVRSLPEPQSRYVSQMYDQAKVLEQAYGTYHALLKQGKTEEAREFLDSNREEIGRYKRVEGVKAAEAKFNEMIRMIERSAMDPEVKRERIQQIQAQKDRVARGVAQ